MTKSKRIKWTFERTEQLEMIALAQLGLGNEAIREETGLSNGEITYGLHKAKALEGYDSGHTYRSEWRRGTGKVVRQVMKTLAPSLRRDAKATLPPLIVHPTPEIVPHGNGH
jgi:hypothetical protein